jgi:5-methylcytosine-specific restriction protein B
VRELNAAIAQDRSLGKGFCIGHSFLCGQERCTAARLRSIVEFDLVPLLEEYWFDDQAKAGLWAERLRSAVE